MRRLIVALTATVAIVVAVLLYRTPAPIGIEAAQPQSDLPPAPMTAAASSPALVPETLRSSSAQPRARRRQAIRSRPTPSPSPTQSVSPSPAAVVSRTVLGPVAKAYQPKMGYVFGDVQIAMTFRAGRILTLSTRLLPPVGDTGGAGTKPITKSISDYAGPLLVREALRAQSANIQNVSGATYTTDAFKKSLQAALLQVHP